MSTTPHRRRAPAALAAAVALTLSLTACNGNSDEESAPPDDDLATSTGPSEEELEAAAYEEGVTAYERLGELTPTSLDDIPMPPEAADYATTQAIADLEESMGGYLQEGWRIDDQTEILGHELIDFTPSTVQTPKGSMTIEFCLGGSATVYDENDEVVGEAGGDPIVSSVDYYREQESWKVRDSGQVEGETCADDSASSD